MPPRKAKKAAASGDVFDGLTFCVSGAFSMSQAEMKSLITENGGKIAGTVTNAVTHVVSDQISSAKTHTAVGKGLPIVSEQWIQDSVDTGSLSTDDSLFVHQPDGSSSKKGKTASKKGKKKDEEEEDEEEEEEEEAPKKKAPAKKAASKKNTATKRKKADDDEKEEEEEEDDAPKKKAPARKSGRATKATKKADDEDEEEDDEEEDEPPAKKSKTEAPQIKKVVVAAGSAPVDDVCPVASECVVYQEGSDVWDAMLNQTNIGNNNNKYYVIQLLQNTKTGEYYAWNKWGRVGAIAGRALVKCGKNLDKAKQDFCKKFKDKTKNNWADRANFTSYPGKYTLLERDYSANDDDMPAADDDADDDADDADGETKTNGNNKKAYPDSKLDPCVQDLVKLICDVRMMEAALLEVGYDAKKLPLGKLSKRHIQQGYEVLKEISDALDKGASSGRLSDLSSKFYTMIPHDFGFRVPPVINNKVMLKTKLEMVEQLADIEIATKLLKGDSQNHKINPLDAHYDHLKCDMKPLDADDETVTLIKKYVKNTHAATHSSYSLEVQQVFDLDREGEAKRYEPFADNENRMLLWHGSRLTNFVGILSQGLRIAPPEAPVTGYMFGKGVYFADMVSKSANYCNTSSGNNIACMLLCEVALGGMNQKLTADYHANILPAGKLSTLGAGRTAPDPKQAVTLDDGVVVPCGPGIDSGIDGSHLLYNEFIVYDTAQIKMRYLIKMKFNYKR